ncbi:MAG: branched-chain amino acid transport system II carrier protein [Neisseria sp.]|nr:branched-chain amino acid transport system II carrier protein [Neisseria sp.]
MQNQKTLSLYQFFILSFFLFSMFLGAGNIIFAPPLGQAAGSNTWLAMSGFLITGVGLVLLAIMALSIAGGSIDTLASRVGSRFAKFYCLLLFLALGPLYVIPRTAAVVFEVSVTPFLGDGVNSLALFLFSSLFIASTIYLSLEPKKFVSRIGRILTPTLLVLLAIIVVKSLVTPIGEFGEPTGDYIDHAFGKGFTQGYYTMDVLAAFVFGKIFIDACRNSGVSSQNMASVFVKAGIFSVLALAVVQLSLAGMGASSVSEIGISRNGGEALPKIVYLLLGDVGVMILACVVFLTGWTTAIACLASVSEYFSRLLPTYSYRAWVWIFGIISLVITNFGLSSILSMASPILYFLYPISITLIALVFLNPYFKGNRAVYIGAVAAASVMGFLDGLKDIDALPVGLQTFLLNYLPFYQSGMGWILVALMGGIMAWLIQRIYPFASQRFDNSPIQ